MKIFFQTCFLGNDFAITKKFSAKKFLMKISNQNLFSRKWFCNHKQFSAKKFLMKIFNHNLFSRKWFCKHKKFSTKKVLMKMFGATCFRGNDFGTLKNYRPKFFQVSLTLGFKETNFQPYKLQTDNFQSDSSNFLLEIWFSSRG